MAGNYLVKADDFTVFLRSFGDLKMKHLMAVLAGLVLSTSALAFGNGIGNTDVDQNQRQGQGQAQGQLQGQAQGQAQRSTNINANKNLSVSRSSSGSSSRSTSGAIAAGGKSIAGAVSGGNTQNVNYSEVRQYKNTPAVMAPDLVTGICMGSVSAGGSGAGFGLSFGSTVNDEECQIRRNAIALKQLGHDAAAVTILCQIPSIALAYSQVKAGICPVAEPK